MSRLTTTSATQTLAAAGGEAFAQGVRWAIRHYERAHGIGIKKGDRHGLKT